MTTVGVWSKVEELAAVWAESPLVQALIAELPLLNPAEVGVPEALRNLDAGTGIVSRQPLMTAMWEPVGANMPLVQMDTEVRLFMRSVAPIGNALELTVGWIRSRLPRYPLIPAPQLASKGYRRCEEYGLRLRWRKQVLQAGLQYQESPPGLAQALRLPTPQAAISATLALATALRDTDEWREYARLSESLSDDDRTALKEACRQINELLAPAKVDEFEPERMARRERIRIGEVDNVIQTLTGTVKDFADAFERVDDLIDLATTDVLGQIVAIGPPIELAVVEDLEIEGQTVRFINTSGTPVAAGNLVRLPDPLVPQVVLVDDVSFASDATSGMVLTYRGRRLSATESAFTASV